MTATFNQDFDDLLGNHPASVYLIIMEINSSHALANVGTRWIPLDEQAAARCSFDIGEVREMTREQLRLLDDVMNFLRTRDSGIHSSWFLIGCWASHPQFFMVVRNSFPPSGEEL
ncbi:hypothetical protein TWF696_009928 [Orbilia brochopaga]|uniref:Uncharacterized protein n=1 Tax=Orbilia brochopaga TaxID=3140254 RepID=A0AAV9V0X9_9PEZI